jgi:acetoacetyl-CoA reductase
MLKLRGYNVAANYAGNDVAASAFKEETGIAVYKFDVSDFDAVKVAVAQIEKDLGAIEIVVNNAGITRDSTMRRLDRGMWDAVIDTNLGSCFNVSKAVWDGMNTRGFGRIVNIGSINGQGGQYGQVNYAAAKSGIHGFTKALAQEGASKGITVNAIAPGYTDTDMVSALATVSCGELATSPRSPTSRSFTRSSWPLIKAALAAAPSGTTRKRTRSTSAFLAPV